MISHPFWFDVDLIYISLCEHLTNFAVCRERNDWRSLVGAIVVFLVVPAPKDGPHTHTPVIKYTTTLKLLCMYRRVEFVILVVVVTFFVIVFVVFVCSSFRNQLIHYWLCSCPSFAICYLLIFKYCCRSDFSWAFFYPDL